ncbi:MAG: hypothetical protein K9M75_01765 [Phycisphaerae bacterium]|nr:hypothetical protein [Phycisphaerae bacterium]
MSLFQKCVLIAIVVLTFSLPASAEPSKTQNKLKVGINLAGPVDWNTELPFVDIFRMARTWISQEKGKPWGNGPKLQVDENGWVKRLEKDCWAETPVNTIQGGHYPGGDYTLLYDGTGEIETSGAGKIIDHKKGRLAVRMTPSKGSCFIRIKQTDPKDYIRNIRFIMPGFEKTYKDNPWHPVFLERWKKMHCFRYMDFMHTNNSKVKTWSDRPKITDMSTSKGMPLELMIDLSNRQKINPWFCIPHLADDEYIRKFAEMVKQKLDPELKIYVEYSNEVWNGIFTQNKYAGQKGIELGLGPKDKPWEAAWHYTAYRSVQIFSIWQDVFGTNKRLVRVLSSQAANPYVARQVLAFQDAYKHADALGIAPYFGFSVSEKDNPNDKVVASWSVEKALDHMENKALPWSINIMGENKKIADEYNLKLVAYEAGQHMVGVGGAENNKQLTELFHKCNSHERMGRIYDKYSRAWIEIGGDTFCHFSSVSNWSKWGSWGLLQYYDDKPTAKFKSVMKLLD